MTEQAPRQHLLKALCTTAGGHWGLCFFPSDMSILSNPVSRAALKDLQRIWEGGHIPSLGADSKGWGEMWAEHRPYS